MKDSQICVRLIGEEGLDACHDLNLNVSNIFQRGGVDQFVITSFLDLGYRNDTLSTDHAKVFFQVASWRWISGRTRSIPKMISIFVIVFSTIIRGNEPITSAVIPGYQPVRTSARSTKCSMWHKKSINMPLVIYFSVHSRGFITITNSFILFSPNREWTHWHESIGFTCISFWLFFNCISFNGFWCIVVLRPLINDACW